MFFTLTRIMNEGRRLKKTRWIPSLRDQTSLKGIYHETMRIEQYIECGEEPLTRGKEVQGEVNPPRESVETAAVQNILCASVPQDSAKRAAKQVMMPGTKDARNIVDYMIDNNIHKTMEMYGMLRNVQRIQGT